MTSCTALMLFWLTLRQTRKILLSGSASGWLTVNPDADEENKHESFVKCPEVAVSQKKVKTKSWQLFPGTVLRSSLVMHQKLPKLRLQRKCSKPDWLATENEKPSRKGSGTAVCSAAFACTNQNRDQQLWSCDCWQHEIPTIYPPAHIF